VDPDPDPCLWLMDPDPSISIIDFQDASKKNSAFPSAAPLFKGNPCKQKRAYLFVRNFV
jgi:hypothetical protein